MLLKLLAEYLRPYRGTIALVVAFQLVQTVAALYLPTLNADIIDKGVATGDTGVILTTGSWMLFVTVIQIVATVTAVFFGARAAIGMGRDLRTAVFARVGSFSEREVSRFGAPSLITRTTNDVQQVQTLVLMSATMMVSAPLMAVGGVILAIREDGTLAWLIAVAVPALLVLVSLIVSRMIPQFRVMQRRIDRVNQVLREQLTGIRVVRAFVREPVETSRFEVANRDVTATAIRTGRLMSLMFPTVMLVLNVSSVAVLWFGSFRIEDGAMQIGTLTAFLSYLMQILMSVMMATFMAVMVPRAAVCADRIGEVLATETTVRPPGAPVSHMPSVGTIVFDAVSFQFPGADAPVLDTVSFEVPAGSTTAIIGSTGSGKTTVLNLAARLLDVTNGSVRVNGVDVRELDPALLWSQLGFVPQKPYLFSGTVASNLRYGKPDATDDELWRALEIAQAADFVREKPLGLDEPIAQGGTNVSGGQRQRLAIARALVTGAQILMFDDSFSALDVRTDARLRAALAEHMAHTTRLIVAQRVASIREAEQIIVLDDGRIVGGGTHTELLASNPTYQEIVSSQLTAEEAAA
ncbi:MAG TPA: ABC transporter ATP-binding protein [Microbacteriaceae bacterium]|nr:ABC transporter ATP-binding protein [Microbacteriaceae bacterium]